MKTDDRNILDVVRASHVEVTVRVFKNRALARRAPLAVRDAIFPGDV